MTPAPITEYVITAQAQWELTRRGLSENTIRAILAAPEQVFEVRPGRLVLQSRVSLRGTAKTVPSTGLRRCRSMAGRGRNGLYYE